MDQGANPKTIALLHGGIFEKDVFLYGRVGTISDDPQSVQLYRDFASALTKRFKRIQTFWLGTEAEALFKRGFRLTIDATSPPEFDLKRED